MSKVDGRGSKPQIHLHGVLAEVYPQYDIIYEQAIPQLNQRIDIFVKELGIAIEYDGQQHFNYVEFFHRDFEGYYDAIKLDNKKEKFLADNGIKLLRLSGDVYDIDKNKLRTMLDTVPYPDTMYCPDIFKIENPQLEKEREYRKARYLKTKESISKSALDR
jgi:hypothetical protein